MGNRRGGVIGRWIGRIVAMLYRNVDRVAKRGFGCRPAMFWTGLPQNMRKITQRRLPSVAVQCDPTCGHGLW